ncbi:MAG TPA: PDR/VanB family oxidoreductase [Thermomicrobiales bacterium]|nr:PDR/VanB family oxidoreductase [Thermomicrobiales bacterium]
MRIARINAICAGVREFVLVPVDPSVQLSPYVPGSHIAVEAGAVVNTYSLTDDGYLPDAYRISVRRQDRGGGSDWLHDHVLPGDQLGISKPRSAFAPVLTATSHLLIAAGIGITPILSHLKAARRWNRAFSLVYGVSAERAPHLDEVLALAGDRVTIAEGRVALTAAATDALRQQPIGTHAYACGPAGFLDRFIKDATDLGWPEERLHVEHFDAPGLDPGTPFLAKVAGSDREVAVPAGVSLLEVLENAGIEVPHLCRRGVCGECRTIVHAGVPDHRDLIQTGAERERNDTIYPCVSRSLSPVLELELDA